MMLYKKEDLAKRISKIKAKAEQEKKKNFDNLDNCINNQKKSIENEAFVNLYENFLARNKYLVRKYREQYLKREIKEDCLDEDDCKKSAESKEECDKRCKRLFINNFLFYNHF